MGRFSAGGVRLHEPRQPKSDNKTFRQGQPPQSHSFSLGLGHPQRAIRPSCREKPTLGVIARPPRSPAQRGCCPGRAAARRVPGISAGKPSKEALHRRSIGKPRQKPAALLGPAEALARAKDSRRQIAASMPHARGRTCPKGPENDLGRADAPTQVHGAQCGTGEAPQERRRGCTRTPRRRRRSGWTGP